MTTKDTSSLSSDQKGLNHPPNDQMEKISEQLRRQGYKVTEEYDNNTGHPSKISGEPPPRKTPWSWLQLILQVIGAIAVPVSIIIGVWQFTTQLAANQAQALDQQYQTTLDTYLDRMSDLLLTYPNHFKVYQQEDQYQAIAEARTYAAVRNLDGVRKGTLVRFLLTAGLISGSQPIIIMSNADLIGAIFANADLSGANLSGANLIGAIFANADLSGTNLSGANLIGAIFTNADLSAVSSSTPPPLRTCQCYPSLGGVTDLSIADLSGAKYNTKTAREGTLTLEPTQWPQGFDPKAYGAICVDC